MARRRGTHAMHEVTAVTPRAREVWRPMEPRLLAPRRHG